MSSDKKGQVVGLDISVYSRIDLDSRHVDEDCDKPGGCVRLYVGAFPEQADGLITGCYRLQLGGRVWGFSCGPYSNYNLWRNELAWFAQSRPDHAVWEDPRGPFHLLIHFSDCEGTIGPQTSAVLAKEFADHQVEAERYAGENKLYFLKKYNEWRAAFECAANGGAVKFH